MIIRRRGYFRNKGWLTILDKPLSHVEANAANNEVVCEIGFVRDVIQQGVAHHFSVYLHVGEWLKIGKVFLEEAKEGGKLPEEMKECRDMLILWLWLWLSKESVGESEASA
jgi:hypothetical protein